MQEDRRYSHSLRLEFDEHWHYASLITLLNRPRCRNLNSPQTTAGSRTLPGAGRHSAPNSERTKLANCSGEVGTISPPSRLTCSMMSGWARISFTARFNQITTSRGVARGTKTPIHNARSKSPMPVSATVGTLGNADDRLAVDTARALS